MSDFLKFPDDFLWGSATSGHQIEGNNCRSDWWHWEKENPKQPECGDAVDYWNRYEEDHKLLAEMGHQAFRLGIEWARIEPKEGQFDDTAIAHYRKILTDLKNRNIKICLTLHHWVLPQWVAKKGGWTNPEITKWFARYTERMIQELGELPHQWITLNEPLVAALAGYLTADFPPQKRNYLALRRVVRNMLSAHVEAYHRIHEFDSTSLVGMAMAYPLLKPWGSRGIGGLYERLVVKLARLFLIDAWDSSVKTGRMHPLYGRGEIEGLADSIDYCGINYYFRNTPRATLRAWKSWFIDQEAAPEDIDRNDFGWQIWPEGIYEISREVWNHFKKPIYITENGIADASDQKRGPYIVEHLKQLHRAIAGGIPVKGYYHWSFIDNFEWKEGFDMRFGLVEVDPADPKLKRTPRPSAELYSDIIQNNGINLSPEANS